ncbi:MAG: peptide chain release factor N(5)-glutamine methyltransferase [Armatimonadetes bacterium]|nr:peptide chain release factor N(5)-glutamine methyltransferase [Armatimonadota bacterium]
MNQDSTQTEIWTIMRLITWGADFFKKRGIESPRLTMELLLAHLLKLSRFDLYLQFERPLKEAELAALRAMVRRRANHEPLQYITGEAPFYKRTFHVTPAVLIPRPETELLVEEALRRAPSLRCLDVGTGSGCIGITVALERPETTVTAIDVSEAALAVARQNAAQLGARNIDFHQIDLFDDTRMQDIGTFDVIVANPPYIAASEIAELDPEVRSFEPQTALTDGGDGYKFHRRLAQLLPLLCREGGNLFVELGYGQAATVRQMFQQAGYRNVTVLTDLDRVERILWVQK